jgi:hypothetical protein
MVHSLAMGRVMLLATQMVLRLESWWASWTVRQTGLSSAQCSACSSVYPWVILSVRSMGHLLAMWMVLLLATLMVLQLESWWVLETGLSSAQRSACSSVYPWAIQLVRLMGPSMAMWKVLLLATQMVWQKDPRWVSWMVRQMGLSQR